MLLSELRKHEKECRLKKFSTIQVANHVLVSEGKQTKSADPNEIFDLHVKNGHTRREQLIGFWYCWHRKIMNGFPRAFLKTEKSLTAFLSFHDVIGMFHSWEMGVAQEYLFCLPRQIIIKLTIRHSFHFVADISSFLFGVSWWHEDCKDCVKIVISKLFLFVPLFLYYWTFSSCF